MDVIIEYSFNESAAQNGSAGFNGTEGTQHRVYNYYAMLLTLLIFVIIFGNVLVCMAVSREKALQTTTNYLIVSLAVADLLVASLVMPGVVYLEVVGEWRLSKIHCDIFVTLDVMMCTASIFNLCAISIDRYTAVALPMLYNTRYSSRRRVTIMISVVWGLSFAISCPLLFGLNSTATRDETECVIANPAFVVYSSIVSFYVPFIITLLVYVQIYVVLRKRRKRVNTKRACHAPETTLKKCTHPEDVKLCTVIVKPTGGFPVSNTHVILIKEVVRQKDGELEVGSVQKSAAPKGKHPDGENENPENHEASGSSDPADGSLKAERNGNTVEPHGGGANPRGAFETRAFETQALPNGKTQTLLKTSSKRKISQQKEKKATQMLAIVLAVFIICWLPFFLTHILNIYCEVPLELYTAFTWLGYVNSAINPIIYTTFNVEFRKAFIKILHC